MSEPAGDPATTFTLRPDRVEWRMVDDEVVVLDLRQSVYLAINRTGAALWPLLAEGATRATFQARLMQRYGITAGRAQSDADAFLATLTESGFLSVAVPETT